MRFEFNLAKWDRQQITNSLLSADYNLKTISWFMRKNVDRECVWLLASKNQLLSTLRRGIGENLPKEINRITSVSYSTFYLFHVLSIVEKIALDVITICANHPYQRKMECTHFSLALDIAFEGLKEAKLEINRCIEKNTFSLQPSIKSDFDFYSTYLHTKPMYSRFAQKTASKLSSYRYIHIWQADLTWARKLCGYENTSNSNQNERIKRLHLGMARTASTAVLKEYLLWLAYITEDDESLIKARQRWKSDAELMWLPF